MAKRTHTRVYGVPLCVPTVLAPLQQVLAAAVVGMLVEDPGPIHHITGVDLTVMEAVMHRGTVVGKLHHLSLEVRTFVNPHAETAGSLEERLRRGM